MLTSEYDNFEPISLVTGGESPVTTKAKILANQITNELIRRVPSAPAALNVSCGGLLERVSDC